MRTKHRNSTDQMLFLIKSDIIKHLFFYFCFFYRSLQLLFKPNQTQKKKKKKNSKSQKTQATNLEKNHISPARSCEGEIAINVAISRRREIAPARSRRRDRIFFWICGLCFLGFEIFFFFWVWFGLNKNKKVWNKKANAQ